MFEIIYEIKKIGIWPEKSAIHYIKKNIPFNTYKKDEKAFAHG